MEDFEYTCTCSHSFLSPTHQKPSHYHTHTTPFSQSITRYSPCPSFQHSPSLTHPHTHLLLSHTLTPTYSPHTPSHLITPPTHPHTPYSSHTPSHPPTPPTHPHTHLLLSHTLTHSPFTLTKHGETATDLWNFVFGHC